MATGLPCCMTRFSSFSVYDDIKRFMAANESMAIAILMKTSLRWTRLVSVEVLAVVGAGRSPSSSL